jgi:zinc protease
MRRPWFPALLLTLCMLSVPGSEALAKPKAERPDSPPPPAAADAAEAPSVDVPYEAFTLPNGLRVVVHEDRKAPIVAVGVWYGVGSADEPEGRTGFAHLFEHLMFNGSENYNHEYFEPFEQVGATDMNGTTWFDRTNYFQNVPTPALELALWMESDRMGHLIGAIDQAKLDEQRGVVQNEKRQGDNAPYGKLEYHVLEGVFPAGHPYRHSTIGSMADLDAATLDDVKAWFTKYYGAANTVLVLAGDIDAEAAKPLVERYFGWIAPGPPVPKRAQWVPVRTENVTETLEDQVPQVRIQRNWAVPGRVTEDRAVLELAAAILGDGKNSRMYKELVHERQIATAATAEVEAHQLASLLVLDVTVAPGKDPQEVEAALDQVVADFLRDGPTAEELGRARTKVGADLVRGLEKIGGFGGKATALAQGELYAGDPSYFVDAYVDRMNEATPTSVAGTARKWLSNGYYQATVRPFGEHEVASETVDRSKLPAVDSSPELEFPTVQEATLDNGTRVVLAERHGVPVVELALQFDAGFAADPRELLGLASFTSAMLDEGTKTRSALALSAELESLGAELGAGSSLDTTSVWLSALTPNLAPSVELLADVVQNPVFAPDEIERLRQRWLARIQQEEAQPNALALRLVPPELYGEGHPYGVPLTGSGVASSIVAIDQAALQQFHQTWLRPDNATLIVVGDTTLEQVLPVLNKAFASWKAPSEPVPTKDVAEVARPDASRVILIDKPNAEQSVILVGQLAPPSGTDAEVPITATNDVLGGQFTARLNMNLREDKHWAYGAYSFMFDAKGQRPYLAFAPVQTDKTAASMAEVARELREFVGKRPATQAELDRVVKNSVRSLPGQYETLDSVAQSLASSVAFGRPWDWPTKLAPAYDALTVDTIRKQSEALVHPEQLVWIVVGDLGRIEAPIRALELGEVEVRSLGDGEQSAKR